MNPTIVAALIGVAGVIVGAAASFWIQSRRLPADIRLTEAQTEKVQHETASGLIQDLTNEVKRQKAEFVEFKEQFKKESDESLAKFAKAEVARVEAEKARVEAERLRAIADARQAEIERRSTNLEARLADAEYSAQRTRQAMIFIGEGRDQDRAKARQVVIKLVGIIEHLLDCVENPSQSNEVDRAAIAGLIKAMLEEYPQEQFVRV